MAKRKVTKVDKASRLASIQKRESEYARLQTLLESFDIPRYGNKREVNNTILKGLNVEAFTVTSARNRDNQGFTIAIDETLKGTFVTLEFKSGMRLDNCFIDANLPRYAMLRQVTNKGTLKLETQSKARAMLEGAFKLDKLIIFNVSSMRVDTARSTAEVWLNASLAFETEKRKYILEGVIIRVDVESSIDAILIQLDAEHKAKLTKEHNAALKALEGDFESKLEIA